MGRKGRGGTLLGSDSLKLIHPQALSAEELYPARPTSPVPPVPTKTPSQGSFSLRMDTNRYPTECVLGHCCGQPG